MAKFHFYTRLATLFAHTVEQVANYTVTHCSYSDLLPLSNQGADHSGTGVGLSRPRRALDGQYRLIQFIGKPDSEVSSIFLFGWSERPRAQLGRKSAQKSTR